MIDFSKIKCPRCGEKQHEFSIRDCIGAQLTCWSHNWTIEEYNKWARELYLRGYYEL